MLKIVLSDGLGDLEFNCWRGVCTMFFQQNACPAHYSRIVNNRLNVKLGNQWIGKNC